VRYQDDKELRADQSMSPLSMNRQTSSGLESPSKLMQQKAQGLTTPDEENPYTHYSFHRCVVQARQDEIPPFAKIPKSHVHVRTFNKQIAPSVFREWREDTSATLADAFRADKENWKLNRFIKDPDDVTASAALL